LTIVVFNNSTLGMVELEMLVEGFPPAGTGLGHVDYARIASAIGLNAVRGPEPRGLRDALAPALASAAPTLVAVGTDPCALSLPPHITVKQIRGFATGAGKTVLAGGVGKMFEMARSNLRNIRAVR